MSNSISYKWKISETVIVEGILKSVKYQVVATENDISVETEGYWTLRSTRAVTPDISESLVAHWVDLDAIQDGKHLIKSRLQEQINAIKSSISTKPPWAVDTFKVTL